MEVSLSSEAPRPRAIKTIADLAVGDRFEKRYTITEDDARVFASLSGDYNPIHFDDEYAAASMFGRRIAHGMLSVAKFSGIFGMDLPGLGTLWEGQEVRFLKAVYLEQEYVAVAEVLGIEGRRVTVATWVEDGEGAKVIEGRAVLIPITPSAKARIAGMLGRLMA